MAVPVTLPVLSWGAADAPRTALLIHGLGSNAALMWRLGEALAANGFYATAPDLRGHGLAPRALDYTLAAYGADVAATRPAHGGTWDLVVGHSLGGAAATVAASADPAWAAQLILLDPGIYLGDQARASVRTGQESSFADSSIGSVQRAHPRWHPHDCELKSAATAQASRWAIEQTSEQNEPWDVRAEASTLSVPTHVIAADPHLGALFAGNLAEEVLVNTHITMSVIAGAGHSLHRDKPEETIAELLAQVIA